MPDLAALLTAEIRQGHLEKWTEHSLKFHATVLGSFTDWLRWCKIIKLVSLRTRKTSRHLTTANLGRFIDS